jgi:hypothetical protein
VSRRKHGCGSSREVVAVTVVWTPSQLRQNVHVVDSKNLSENPRVRYPARERSRGIWSVKSRLRPSRERKPVNRTSQYTRLWPSSELKRVHRRSQYTVEGEMDSDSENLNVTGKVTPVTVHCCPGPPDRDSDLDRDTRRLLGSPKDGAVAIRLEASSNQSSFGIS